MGRRFQLSKVAGPSHSIKRDGAERLIPQMSGMRWRSSPPQEGTFTG